MTAHKTSPWKRPHRVAWLALRYILCDTVNTWRYVFKKKAFSDVRADYEEYWHRRTANQQPPRFSIIASEIEADASVLDLGCGSGDFLATLKDAGHKGSLVGLDGAQAAVDRVHDRGFDAQVQNFQDESWQPHQAFDYIVASEVLEHLPEPESLLTRVIAHTRRALLISIPNTGYYRHRMRLWSGRFPIQWEWFPGEHLRFWTVADFRDWAACLGLDVERVIGTSGFPVLCRWWPALFAEQVVYRLVRREPVMAVASEPLHRAAS